jgi:hypothetical protein
MRFLLKYLRKFMFIYSVAGLPGNYCESALVLLINLGRSS